MNKKKKTAFWMMDSLTVQMLDHLKVSGMEFENGGKSWCLSRGTVS